MTGTKARWITARVSPITTGAVAAEPSEVTRMMTSTRKAVNNASSANTQTPPSPAPSPTTVDSTADTPSAAATRPAARIAPASWATI